MLDTLVLFDFARLFSSFFTLRHSVDVDLEFNRLCWLESMSGLIIMMPSFILQVVLSYQVGMDGSKWV